MLLQIHRTGRDAKARLSVIHLHVDLQDRYRWSSRRARHGQREISIQHPRAHGESGLLIMISMMTFALQLGSTSICICAHALQSCDIVRTFDAYCLIWHWSDRAQ
jgi:hypothetical protein